MGLRQTVRTGFLSVRKNKRVKYLSIDGYLQVKQNTFHLFYRCACLGVLLTRLHAMKGGEKLRVCVCACLRVNTFLHSPLSAFQQTAMFTDKCLLGRMANS